MLVVVLSTTYDSGWNFHPSYHPPLICSLLVGYLRSCPDNPFQALDYKGVEAKLAVVMYYSLIIY